jgi:Fusaric acid resistance protein-like
MPSVHVPSHDEDVAESECPAFERSGSVTLPSGDEASSHLDEIKDSSDAPIDPAPPSRHASEPRAVSRVKSGLETLLCGASADTLVFSCRFSVSMAIASLFLVSFPTSEPWPDSVWILITCILVTWQPSIDAGTVFKMFIEMIAGTWVGAVLAFGVGHVSLAVGSTQGQAAFLGIVFAVEGFLYPYFVDRLGYHNSCGALVGSMTFGITLFAFYDLNGDNPPWVTAVYRVLNVFIGCVIAAVVSACVYPVSTRTLLTRNVRGLIDATGKDAGMVLQAASQSIESGTRPRSLSVLLRNLDSGNVAPDPVHESYIEDLDGLKNTRALIPNLKYDPWFCVRPKEERGELRYAMTMLVDKTLAIQMNIVLLYSTLRSEAEYKGPVEAIGLLPLIGKRIETVLSVKLVDDQVRNAAVRDLLDEHLPIIRAHASQAACQSSLSGDSTQPTYTRVESMLDAGPATFPISILNKEGGRTQLLFQLIEQLIIRVANLHFCLEQCRPVIAKEHATVAVCSINAAFPVYYKSL